mmetsp:Transcript_70658/g.195281  ORF Transcript_70658/g.195281 Transcript_70658/m.195281 type:complete len:207 (+) Transcript_70658:627-1247(+)
MLSCGGDGVCHGDLLSPVFVPLTSAREVDPLVEEDREADCTSQHREPTSDGLEGGLRRKGQAVRANKQRDKRLGASLVRQELQVAGCGHACPHRLPHLARKPPRAASEALHSHRYHGRCEEDPCEANIALHQQGVDRREVQHHIDTEEGQGGVDPTWRAEHNPPGRPQGPPRALKLVHWPAQVPLLLHLAGQLQDGGARVAPDGGL